MREKIDDLLRGSIDYHVHASPDTIKPRRQTMIEVAESAAECGLKAIVFKSHHGMNSCCVNILNEIVRGITVVGGVVLNYSVGGINPAAVKASVELGGKIVWMPCLDSAWTYKKVKERNSGRIEIYRKLLDSKSGEDGISIFSDGLEGNELSPNVIEVLRIIAHERIILETSHCSPREIFALVGKAKEIGVERIVCTHVNSDIIGLTIDQQKELAEAGAYLMYTFAPCMPGRGGQTVNEIVTMIKAVGVERCIIATDFGAIDNPPPIEGLRMFITHLLKEEVSSDEIEIMCKVNPSSLLDI